MTRAGQYSGHVGPLCRIPPPRTDGGKAAVEAEAVRIASLIRRQEFARATLDLLADARLPAWVRAREILDGERVS